MSNIDLKSTIVALGSGPSSASRAIVRLSGERTAELLQGILSQSSSELLGSKSAVSWHSQCLLSAERFDGLTSDQGAKSPSQNQSCANRALPNQPLSTTNHWAGRWVPARVYYWPNSKCYTGEPSAEIHVPGNLFLAEQLIKVLTSLGARHAQRGEFTLRSFLAGKIDLTQAEGVLGVIESSNEVALEEALGRLGGNISKPVKELRADLLELIAHLEAGLDFIEEDIEFITEDALRSKLTAVNKQIEDLIEQVTTRASTQTTPRFLLVGQPNAGKSSLFNLLLDKDRAIVSNRAGTTRDAIVAELDCQGITIEIVDTAGLEERSEDSPRGIAQQVVLRLLTDCDGAIVCQDVSLPEWDAELTETQRLLQTQAVAHLCFGTKADLLQSDIVSDKLEALIDTSDRNARETVLDSISRLLKANGEFSRSLSMQEASLRCQQGLSSAKESVAQAFHIATEHGLRDQEELVAVELRFALDDLGSVIGEVHNEDILGEIFSRFCIGK